MTVRNVHERLLRAPANEVGALLDGLAGPSDRLWPRDRWPAMRLDRPLQVGAAGGHGPIRYYVEAWEPGRWVRFRFTRPKGFLGTHEFAVESREEGALLRHTLEMEVTGAARLTWPLVFRPLHDALIEDALDRAARAADRPPDPPARWSLRVRLLRWLLRRLGRTGGPGGGGRRAAGSATGEPPSPALRSDRLALEPVSARDLDALHALWTEPGVRRFLWDGRTISRDEVAEVLETSRALFRTHGAGLWAVRAGSGGELIGCAGFWPFHDPPELELLLSLTEARWGRGLGREAARALIDFAFGELGWDRVQASADEPNQASLALIRSLGMAPAGHRPGEFGRIEVFRLEREVGASPSG